MTIHIFGDSFSSRYDDCYYDGEIGDLWYDIVMKETGEDVINTSEGGKGPYTSFKFFYEHVEENNIKEDDKIIFMLSSQYRLPFKFLDDKDLGYDYIDYFLNNESIFPREIKLYIENFSYDILSTYDTLKEEIDRANIKNLYFYIQALRSIFSLVCGIVFVKITAEDNSCTNGYCYSINHYKCAL